jgi:hypothetical protein
VPVPKSNTRDQVLVAAGFTQAAIVKSVSPLTTPAGRVTYSLLPLSLMALPIRPGARGPGAAPPVRAPPASVKGPRGESPTATPIDMEFVAAFWTGTYQ